MVWRPSCRARGRRIEAPVRDWQACRRRGLPRHAPQLRSSRHGPGQRGVLPDQQAARRRRVRRRAAGWHGWRRLPAGRQRAAPVCPHGQPPGGQCPRRQLQPRRHARHPRLPASDVQHGRDQPVGQEPGLRRRGLQGLAGLTIPPRRPQRAALERLRHLQALVREVGDRQQRRVQPPGGELPGEPPSGIAARLRRPSL